MKIQFNTDKTIDWDKRHDDHFTSVIIDELERFRDHITRVEVHLSDENGAKEGVDDIRCLMEARMEGRKPIAVTNKANSAELAIDGAITKINTSVRTIVDKMRN